MDPVTWTFTTGVRRHDEADLDLAQPGPDATNVSSGTTVTAMFDEAVQQSTISFELRNPAANLVAGTTSYDAATRTATLTPNSPLAASTTYTARSPVPPTPPAT